MPVMVRLMAQPMVMPIPTITTMITGLTMTTITPTIMTDNIALIRLMTWLSPAFPVGGFNYSHGLEQAVADGLVHDRTSLQVWLEALLGAGSAWNDLVLLAQAWRLATAGEDLSEIADLAEALAGSRERHLETINQGTAFLLAATVWDVAPPTGLGKTVALPVAVGALSGASGLPLETTLGAFLLAFVTNQLQVAQRLLPIGQSGAVAVQSNLEALIAKTAMRAENSGLDDLGSMTFNAEIAALKHETLATRIFVT